MDLSKGRTVASKWLKTTVLLHDIVVARYIPPTLPFTPYMFSTFLSKYKKIVLKPSIGTGGHGILLISQEGAHRYSIHYYSKIFHYQSFKAILVHTRKIIAGRSYLIQPAIHLASIQGSPIDYRVKIVKLGNQWVFRALVGRLAKKGLFVTNLCRGGSQLTFIEGIQRSLGISNVQQIKQEIKNITRRSTRILEKQFPGIKQLGFDFGVDRKGRIWLFEVNTDPH